MDFEFKKVEETSVLPVLPLHQEREFLRSYTAEVRNNKPNSREPLASNIIFLYGLLFRSPDKLQSVEFWW